MSQSTDRDRVWLVLGAAGVTLYIVTWGVTGLIWDGYDAVEQAISELFAIGAPAATRVPLATALVLSGLLTVPYAVALHRTLPGRGVAGPVAAGIAGVFTVLAVVFPCTEGCPGAGTSTTDLLHTTVAGIGYVGLTTAPLFVAWRIREHHRSMVAVSMVLGLIGFGGFLLRINGFGDAETGGLLQRIFNTSADLWYVVMAIWLVRRSPEPA